MHRDLIQLPPHTRPILVVVIHTEEEFDWDLPHDRNATGVRHMEHIDRVQRVFDTFGIVPNYVVDYPIATKAEAVAPLKSFADSGRALIGTHLHPWVSPPFGSVLNICAAHCSPVSPGIPWATASFAICRSSRCRNGSAFTGYRG